MRCKTFNSPLRRRQVIRLLNTKHSRFHFPYDGHKTQNTAYGFSTTNKNERVSGNEAYVKYHSFNILPELEIPRLEYCKNITMKFDALSANILCTKSNFSTFYLPVFLIEASFSFRNTIYIKHFRKRNPALIYFLFKRIIPDYFSLLYLGPSIVLLPGSHISTMGLDNMKIKSGI